MIRITAAIIALFAMVTSSYAYERHRPHPIPHRHYHSIAPWVLGGVAAGALGIYALHPRRYYDGCVDRFVGYDQLGRKVYQTFCPDYY